MTQEAVPLQHPLERCVAAVRAVIDDAAGSSAAYLSTAAKREVLLGLSQGIARLEAMRLAVLAAASDVADEDAARSPGVWLGLHARVDRPEAARLQRLAEALDERYAAVAAGLLSGALSRAQAEVIVAALDDLPSDVEAEVRAEAERHLVEHAPDFGPRELRVLGRRILDVVAPAVAEEHERRALVRDEQRSRRRMRLTTVPLGDGLTRVCADLPTLHVDLLLTQLHAYASPRRDHVDGDRLGVVERRDPESGERLSHSRLLAHAFCSLLERLPAAATPDHGGTAATLVVTIDQAQLQADLGVARLDTGNSVSVGEARRLACSAGILPMVLGGGSQPLDVGRARRFHTPAMRKALAVRDRECRAQGCEIPAAWCEAHHLVPWASSRGPTNVDDGLLLCSFHHHRAHDKRYDMSRSASGDVRFHRRT